jgi:hypothetical protein
MDFSKRLYSTEAINDSLDDEIYDIQKLDVEEEIWQEDTDRFISYYAHDDYTFIDTNEEGINDLISDEIYDTQREDVERNHWGDLLDEPDAPIDSGRSEYTLS